MAIWLRCLAEAHLIATEYYQVGPFRRDCVSQQL